MIDFITNPIFLWVAGFVLGSGLVMWIVSYVVASYIVYNRTLRKKDKNKWGREDIQRRNA